MSHQNILTGTQRHKIQTGDLRIKGQLILQDSPIFPSPQKKVKLSPCLLSSTALREGTKGHGQGKKTFDWLRLSSDTQHSAVRRRCKDPILNKNLLDKPDVIKVPLFFLLVLWEKELAKPH